MPKACPLLSLTLVPDDKNPTAPVGMDADSLVEGWDCADLTCQEGRRAQWDPVWLGAMSCAPDPEKRVLLEAEGGSRQFESGSVAETIRQEAERRSKEGHPMEMGC